MSGSATNPEEVPSTASLAPRGKGSARPGQVALAHLGVTLLGAGVLIWVAQPVSGSAWESWPNAGFWQLLVGSAAVVGGIGGVLEGLALRYGLSWLAVVVLVGAAVPGLWLPLLTLGRWYPDQGRDLIETGLLVAGLIGWLLLMVVIAAVAASVSGAGPRRSPHDD